LLALPQSGCVGKPPAFELFCRPVHAHLSPFSAPLASVQPVLGNGSLSVSPCSWPATIETPSIVPGVLTLP